MFALQLSPAFYILPDVDKCQTELLTCLRNLDWNKWTSRKEVICYKNTTRLLRHFTQWRFRKTASWHDFLKQSSVPVTAQWSTYSISQQRLGGIFSELQRCPTGRTAGCERQKDSYKPSDKTLICQRVSDCRLQSTCAGCWSRVFGASYPPPPSASENHKHLMNS